VNDRFKNNGRGLADRSNAGLVLAGRLKDDLGGAALPARLEAVSRQFESADPVINKDLEISASPLPRLSAGPTPQTNAPLAALTALLLGLSGIVLVIACLNIANMLLARGSARRKELALRLALGAHRGRIVRQLLTESLLLAVAGAGVGLVVSYWAMGALVASLTSVLPFHLMVRVTPDGAVLGATAAFTALSTLAFGLGPALRLSRRDLIADLKDRQGDGPATSRRFGARNLMVVGQVALSLGLLTAGGIFARTVAAAASNTPGYAYDRLLVASLDTTLAGLDEPQARGAYASVLNALRSAPGVEAVSLASTVPFGDSIDSARLESVGAGPGEPVRARAFRIIGADYFATLGIPVLRGREFTRLEEQASGGPRVAIVDEAFARELFGDADPVGRLIRVVPAAGAVPGPREEPMEIVGLAPPLREELLDRAPVPHVYVPLGGTFRAGLHVHVRLAPGVNERTALDLVRKEIRAAQPALPVLALSTLSAFYRNNMDLWALKAGAWVFAGLGGIALVIAALGVYGLRAYIVSQRTREIGIRLALGASPRDVLQQLLREGVLLVGAGVAIGVPLAALVSIAFASVFVDIGGLDAGVIAASAIVLALSAIAATIVPARRAARVQPLSALRTD
jgi:predicted permease